LNCVRIFINPLHSRGDSRSPHDLMPQHERWLSLTTRFNAAIREVTLAHHFVWCGNSMCGDNYLCLISLVPKLFLYNLTKMT